MKIKSTIWKIIMIYFLFVIPLFAQETIEELQTISGKTTYLNTPLSNVNIIVNDNDRGTDTDSKGQYAIEAKIGDKIIYSYVGFETITILVEDITSVLNIEMVIKTNDLNETVIKASKDKSDFKKSKEKFATSKGGLDPETAGYSVAFIDGEKVNLIYPTLTEALVGKVAGVRLEPSTGKLAIRTRTSINNDAPVIWDIDGIIYNDEPPLDLNNIKSIHILKSVASTNRYGSLGAGGVIVVQTKDQYHNTRVISKVDVAKRYTNKNYYNNDAVSISEFAMFENSAIKKLKQFNDKNNAYAYYNETLQKGIVDYSTQISISKLFYNYYKDPVISINILKDLSGKYKDNPEILKAIAYQMQEINFNAASISVYKSIFKLRPNYAQSYRDLANAFIEKDNYKMAWRLYMSYLLQGKDISGQAIGDLLYNEMEWLYYNRKNQAEIKESFIPKNSTIEGFRNDIRIVFEWNTSEAEFELEFVNPDKQAYVYKHSLAANQELITNEKKIGYSSKEFLISDLKNGEWMMNINYFGNKKLDPTYFKVTVYNNWGSPNQTKQISLFKFKNEREKIQLFTFMK
jgi:hypothetical protein